MFPTSLPEVRTSQIESLILNSGSHRALTVFVLLALCALSCGLGEIPNEPRVDPVAAKEFADKWIPIFEESIWHKDVPVAWLEERMTISETETLTGLSPDPDPRMGSGAYLWAKKLFKKIASSAPNTGSI